MAMIKLSDWCKKHGIKYLTGYRWFRDGKMPVNAYQTATKTILVDDTDFNFDECDVSDLLEENTDSSPIAMLLKETINIGKMGASAEDLAAYVVTNFNLEWKHTSEKLHPALVKAPRIKPASAEAQGHFQKFLTKPTKKPAPNMFLIDEQTLNEISEVDTGSFLTAELVDKFRSANVLEQPVNKSMSVSNVSSLVNAMQAEICTPLVLQDLTASGFPGDANMDNSTPEFTMTYDEARVLVDLMVQAKMVDNNMLVIDRQAKEICKWPPSAAEVLKNHLIEMLDSKVKKVTNKGKK